MMQFSRLPQTDIFILQIEGARFAKGIIESVAKHKQQILQKAKAKSMLSAQPFHKSIQNIEAQ